MGAEMEMTSKELASAQATAFKGRATWGSKSICDHANGDYREIAMRVAYPDPDWEAYAERMTICVNAMTGIPDPAATMKEVREFLRRIVPDDTSYVFGPAEIVDARALLAKLGGE